MANRMSRPSASAASNQRGRQTPRIESRVSVTLPNSFSAARRADAGIFAALDPFLDAEREVAANLVVELVLVGTAWLLLARGRRVHDPSDGVYELRPPVPLARQLRLAGRRQPVVLRSLVGLAHAPLAPSASRASRGGAARGRASRFRP